MTPFVVMNMMYPNFNIDLVTYFDAERAFGKGLGRFWGLRGLCPLNILKGGGAEV